jgi:group I intron endonuclease
MGYIYKITNTINNKAYIGQSIQHDINVRWSAHKHSLKHNNGCPLLMAAFRKYGIDKFKFEIIVICFDDACYELEKHYIKKYNTFGKDGYNATEGGEPGGFFKGCHHKPESIAKMKLAFIEYYKSAEIRQKHGDKIKEKYRTDPTYREKISNVQKERVQLNQHNLQYKRTDEQKEKIRQTVLAYYASNTSQNVEMRNNVKKKMSIKTIARIGRSIYQIKNDKIIASYICIKEAADKTGVPRSSIQATTSGRMKIAGGFSWQYTDTFATIQSFFHNIT